MGKRRSVGQRRSEKVLARRRRARGGGTVCIGSAHPAVCETADVAPTEPDALDVLLATDHASGVGVLVGDAVVATVRRTLEERSAAPGELLAARLAILDDDHAETVDLGEHCECCSHHVDPDDGPSEWAWMVLGRWLLAARSRWRDDAGRADEVVAWVSTQLDRRGPAVDRRAQYLGAHAVPVTADHGATDVSEHDIAELVWLVSGLVDVAGGGDVGWLGGLSL